MQGFNIAKKGLKFAYFEKGPKGQLPISIGQKANLHKPHLVKMVFLRVAGKPASTQTSNTPSFDIPSFLPASRNKHHPNTRVERERERERASD